MDNLIKPTLRRCNQNQKKKPVRCIETGVVFSSGRDAADILSANNIIVSQEDIRKVCRGERKSAGGYHWEYAENN